MLMVAVSYPDAAYSRGVNPIPKPLQVLRDTGRRAQYDAARSAAPDGPRGGFPSGVYQPGVSEDAFEAAFRRWWEKAGAE